MTTDYEPKIVEWDKDGKPLAACYHNFLIHSLKDRSEAEAYLKAAAEDDDVRVYEMAKQNVIEAGHASLIAG